MLFAIQKIKPNRKSELVDLCLSYDIKVAQVPYRSEWLDENFKLGEIKEIEIEDLLDRATIALDKANLERQYRSKKVIVTGGLAGDAARFEKTLVGYNANPDIGNIIAVGMYGDDYYIGYGSFGGWNSFGPKRLVTKSDANILYELDGQSALELYKKYLGDKAKDLPGSALLFPLSIQLEQDAEPIVRTILSIDETTQSMVFAGDVPEGSKVQLMMASVDAIADGAYEAAKLAMENRKNEASTFKIGSRREMPQATVKASMMAILTITSRLF